MGSEKDKEYRRRYYTRNKEAFRVRSRAYREKNKDLLKEKRQAKERTPEHQERRRVYARAYASRKRKENDAFRLQHILRTRLCELVRSKGLLKNKRTVELLGCDWETLLVHLGPRPSPDYDIDHICPLSQGQTEAEIFSLCHYVNLRWMYKQDNVKKGNRWTPEGEVLCQQLLGRAWIHKERT